MRNYINIIALLLIVFTTSCSDVIDVDVQSSQTRLVIQASLDWEKGSTGNEQLITLSTSTEFFDTTSSTTISGASVIVSNDSSGMEFIFTDQNNGAYSTTEFIPVLNESYTLEIIYNGETYSAQETLKPVTDITRVYQERDNGFDDEELEVNIEFTDPVDEQNFYLFRFHKQGELLPDFVVGSDKFSNGNVFDFGYGIDEDDDTEKIEAFVPGDIVTIEMNGVSEAYKNYMEILISQVGGVGLFSATPVSVKGNCINLTNPDNYANGYFRLTEVNKVSYTFE